MNYLIAAFVGIVALIGGMFINPNVSNYDGSSPSESIFLGATNFPTSLDTLTNPASTDSVSTVSHSSQHANANDAVEALEAKVGISASTPFTGTVMVGDGTGTSRWSTYATTTNINTTNLEVSASSTIQNITLNNATSTNATTTNFYSSGTASTTSFYGAKLTACTGSNFLNWTGGSFSCGASSATITSFSTTTSVAMATATIPTALIPSTDNLIITIMSSTTEAANLAVQFNSDIAAKYSTMGSESDGGSTAADFTFNGEVLRLLGQSSLSSSLVSTRIVINNFNNKYKSGNYTSFDIATSTPSGRLATNGSIFWKNDSGRITNIVIAPWVNNTNAPLFAAGTYFSIVGY